MKAASALATDREASPELARRAVEQALSAAGMERAEQVVLLLTRDFAHQAPAAVRAAARAAGSLQVFGATVSGLFTEQDIVLDQPGAAVLILDKTSALEEAPRISLSTHHPLPFDWRTGAPRIGLLDADAEIWNVGRKAENGCAEIRLPGRVVLSTGLRAIGQRVTADHCSDYELRAAGGLPAAECLLRSLPAEMRAQPPLHRIALLREKAKMGVAILSINADASLTLTEPLQAGEHFFWATRHPLGAEQDMRDTLRTASSGRQPAAGLMFSCIGRGPLFYGEEDRDRRAFCELFPGVPLLGAYGSGQIAPCDGENRLHHHSVASLLIEENHV